MKSTFVSGMKVLNTYETHFHYWQALKFSQTDRTMRNYPRVQVAGTENYSTEEYFIRVTAFADHQMNNETVTIERAISAASCCYSLSAHKHWIVNEIRNMRQ